MKGDSIDIKNDWVWKPPFKIKKWLSLKVNIEWNKNNCVWKAKLLMLKIIVYERQLF